MTAHAMAGDEALSLEAGMNDHVTKPIDPDRLFAALDKWILSAPDRKQPLQPDTEISQEDVQATVASPPEDSISEAKPSMPATKEPTMD